MPERDTTISEVLVPRLRELFSDRGLRIGVPPSPCAIFPGIHPDVGQLELYDGGHEATVVLVNFTHIHFSNYDTGLTKSEKAHEIAESVVHFLRDLFADKIVFWRAGSTSGLYRKGHDLSVPHVPQEFVWSGPVAAA